MAIETGKRSLEGNPYRALDMLCCVALPVYLAECIVCDFLPALWANRDGVCVCHD